MSEEQKEPEWPKLSTMAGEWHVHGVQAGSGQVLRDPEATWVEHRAAKVPEQATSQESLRCMSDMNSAREIV